MMSANIPERRSVGAVRFGHRMRALVCLLAMALLVLSGVSGCKGGAGKGQDTGSASAPPRTGSDAAALLNATARYLPADTVVVASVDLSGLLGGYGALLSELLGMSQAELNAMRAEIDAFLLARLGWSLREIHWGLLGVSESEQVVLIVHGDMQIQRGLEPLPGSKGLKGLRLEDQITLIPLSEQGLYALLFDKGSIKWFTEHTTSLTDASSQTRLDLLRAVLEKGGRNSFLSAAAVFEGTKFARKLFSDAPPPVQKLRAASFTVGNTMSLVLHANNQDLVAINALLEGLIAQAEKMLAQKHAELPKLETAEGLMVIFASHLFKPAVKKSLPQISGDFATVSMDLESNAMGLLAVSYITGIMAAISIPVFKKYEGDSKNIEAKINLKAIGDGAISHFNRKVYDPVTGQVTTGRYPIVATEVCTSTGGTGEKAVPVAADFERSPWKELRFGLYKPHYFLYCYQSEPDGSGFTATATMERTKFQLRGAVMNTGSTNEPVTSAVEDISF